MMQMARIPSANASNVMKSVSIRFVMRSIGEILSG